MNDEGEITMTMNQYVNETQQLKEKLTINNPEAIKIVEKLGELYKAAINEPWWPEYIKSI